VTILDLGSGSDLVVVTWFVSVQGRQTWLIAQGPIVDRRIDAAPAQLLEEGHFGEAFEADQVQRLDWGSLNIEFDQTGETHSGWSGPVTFRGSAITRYQGTG